MSSRFMLACLIVTSLNAAEPPNATAFASRAGWIEEPNGKDTVSVTIHTAEAWSGTLRLEICDAEGRLQTGQEQPVTVPTNGEVKAESQLAFDAAPGERLLRWRLLTGPKEDRKQVAGWELSAMVATDEYAFILFNKEPVARGMEFGRDHNGAQEITTHGLKRWIWKAAYQSHPQGWWHSIYATLTDPAFQDGKAPVADITAQVVQRSDAPFNLSADTAKGGGVVENGWGSRGPGYSEDPPWMNITAHLDDARFSHTAHPGSAAGAHITDGCDIRYNACTADGEIRSLVVHRYRREGKVDWTRLLRPLGVDCGKDRYVFAPGSTINAKLKLANRAAIPFTAQADVVLVDYLDKELWKRRLAVEIKPDSEGALSIPIDGKGLPLGVYTMRVDIAGLVKTETYVAFCDETPIPKAKDGEFLYGTDGGAGALDWIDFIGFDMVRNCASNWDDPKLDEAIADLKRRGLRSHIMTQSAWNADPAKRAEENARLAAGIAQVAKKHGDFLKYYELGNEPDLPYFFAGDTTAYAEGYSILWKAIKDNDADSVVLNGGLCFHGKDGWERAHEIIAKLPAEQVDAWAYHGHGPGAGAERGAWNRQDKAVNEVGKGHRDYIETESGFSAFDPPNRRRQAQTMVEKFVFAQSKKMPFFLWFSIFTSDWGYACIERDHEPRPVMLSARTMTKLLKGLAWKDVLDLKAQEAEAYLFANPADGRCGLVLWSDRGEITRTIAIGPGGSGLTRTDLFGNAVTQVEAAPGLIQVTFTADPVFITWKTGDAAFVVNVPPPPLALPARLSVVPGRTTVLPLTVCNPTGATLDATIRLGIAGAAPVKPVKVSTAVQVTKDGETAMKLAISVDAVVPSAWPRQWTVFAPLKGDLEPWAYRDIPTEIAAAGVNARPLLGMPDDGNLDIGAIAGGHGMGKQSLSFAWLESDRDREVEIGAAADWWMEWYVNGLRVYSTMDQGNLAPQHILSHVFKAQLKKGRNLLVVRVNSGSDGFRLVSGGPDEVAAARRERSGDRDALIVELLRGDRVLAREPVVVEVLHPVDRLVGTAEWNKLAIDGRNGQVTNLFVAQPETSRHYHGDDDLSARVWLRQKGESLVVSVAVHDDLQKPGDRVLVRLACGPQLEKRSETAAKLKSRDDGARLTWYELEIAKAQIGADRFALQVQIDDDDWGELKQWTTWSEGKDPERWFQSWLH